MRWRKSSTGQKAWRRTRARLRKVQAMIAASTLVGLAIWLRH